MPYADTDKQRRYQRAWKQRQPATLLRKLGKVCASCGGAIDWTIDCVRWKQEAYWISEILSKAVRLYHAEIADYQLVHYDCPTENIPLYKEQGADSQ